jgi:guanylate kinase
MSLPTSRLVVLAGPTAVGKGTVAAYVRKNFPEVWLSVSMTTRKPRPREIDGKHYHFVNDEEFDRMRDAGEFLEWAVVHRRARYGTPRAPVLAALAAGRSWRLTFRVLARCGSRCQTPCSSSWPRRAGTSWCVGWSGEAPSRRRNERSG